MPDPYVDPSTLERELTYEANDFGIQTATEWESLLESALSSATHRINNWTDDSVEWLGASDTVPADIQEAVIRLARLRIANIKEDGLSSETSASQASLSYRPPSDIIAEIKTELEEAGYRTTDSDSQDFEFFAI
jgi:hypothetical protein